MSCSPAQLAANRRNAEKSTGPKTAEGKARSRCNALKHGLTGSGVALPSEDQVEIGKRYDDLKEEMKPSSAASAAFLRRFAFMTVRMERCERNDNAVLSKKVRHAVAQYDDVRLSSIESQAGKLYQEPATTVRRLKTSPEGIDWLINEWEILRADLNHAERNCWTSNHRSRFDSLMGRNPGEYRVGRIMALSEALDGSFRHLDHADGEGLEGPARVEWTRAELNRLIDAEVASLKLARDSFDHEGLDRDRAESVDRVLFDPSPEMTLARKYEAATERAMYKAYKEFRQAEAQAEADRARPPVEPDAEEPGSFEPETPEETPDVEVDDEIASPAPPRLHLSDSGAGEMVDIGDPEDFRPPGR